MPRLLAKKNPDLKTPRPRQRAEVAERGEAGEGLPPRFLPPDRFGPWRAWAVVLGIAILGGNVGCASAEVGPTENNRDAAPTDTPADRTVDKGQNSDGQPPDNKPGGTCDPFSNSGCSSGQKCTALRNGGSLVLGCGDKQGDKSEGEDCTPDPSPEQQTGDDCGNGFACFRWAGETDKCHQLCPKSGSGNRCPTGEACNRKLPGIDLYGACGDSCRPLDQSGCASDEACYMTSSGPLCAKAGPTKIGQGCTGASSNECEGGSTCVTGLGDGNKCLAFCSASGGSPGCSTTCNKVPVDDVLLSEPNVGTCR